MDFERPQRDDLRAFVDKARETGLIPGKSSPESEGRYLSERFFNEGGWAEKYAGVLQTTKEKAQERGRARYRNRDADDAKENPGWTEENYIVDAETELIQREQQALAAQFARAYAQAYPDSLGLDTPGRISVMYEDMYNGIDNTVIASNEEVFESRGGFKPWQTKEKIDEEIRRDRTEGLVYIAYRYEQANTNGAKGKLMIQRVEIADLYPTRIADEFFELINRPVKKRAA